MIYQKAVLDIRLFATEDVITTSNPTSSIPSTPPEPTGNVGCEGASN